MEVVPESHEKTLNALRGHLTGRRPTEDSITPKSEEGSIAGMQLTDRSSLPPKKRKSFHVPEEPVAVVATPPTVGSSALALEPISPALPLDESRYAVVAGPSRQTVIQEPGFSGYATYVNENQPSHLGFYSDLSRQYSTNVAFAQTLLQQGHYYPSFRYSCVTTNAIRGGRPIHVPNGESTSMYANWTAVPSVINPTIRVDSSGYGKKKTDNTYYSLASKRSVNVGATSVETYTRKRQLILNGRNSFLPGEALRLMQPDVVPTVRPDEGQAPSTFFFRALDSTQAGGGARLTEGIKVEDVSEDEDEDVEKVACTDCGRFFPKTKKLNKAKFVCLNCKAMGRSRAETMPKQARPVPQSRRPSEAVTRPDSGSSLNDHENRPSGATGKPLMAQLKQKIIGHQQPGPSSSTPGSRSEMPFHASEVKMETDEANFAPSSVDHDAMDLSVKKTTAPVVAVPDWRTMEGAGNRFPCRHCPKIFNKEGQLYLHNRVHEIDTAGKGERKASKAKSERCSSPGSVSATNENPRPFFCAECTVGFRIHGHLQKHLRSKGHITQLECLNRLPCGFYAELERQNMIAKLHTIIDTADCAKAFSCLNQLAKTVTVGATLPDEPSLPAPSIGIEIGVPSPSGCGVPSPSGCGVVPVYSGVPLPVFRRRKQRATGSSVGCVIAQPSSGGLSVTVSVTICWTPNLVYSVMSVAESKHHFSEAFWKAEVTIFTV
ncbi:hypothetical protein BV898_12983 [Hypsibius exemplaris]|uniref:C2H2-type domain-containing protein n=1 Tax=Hypsibius exemplaris TaxID=2072580 RepID=A0A1W0WC69_HYPEX|nr:hypothetical protein BV898_12983 [Hypsibius exemplaris]